MFTVTSADEFSVFSQYGEDGIIEAILRQLPAKEDTRVFLEIGWHPDENNTNYLAFDKGWIGRTIDQIEWGADIVERVTPQNIHEIMAANSIPYRLDLLSMDIDGQDYWVLDAILRSYRPTIIVVEYNAAFGPDASVTVPQDPDWEWDGTDWFGASLQALAYNCGNYGYTLVYANGCNAFFVAGEVAGGGGNAAAAARRLFQPACYPNHTSSPNLENKVMQIP